MTEFMQPIHPMRITTGPVNDWYTTPVFAIAISNQHDVEYLTINSRFYTPDKVKFAEMCINGQWVRMEHTHFTAT